MKFNAEITNVTANYVEIRVYGFKPPYIRVSHEVAKGFDFEPERRKELRVDISEP